MRKLLGLLCAFLGSILAVYLMIHARGGGHFDMAGLLSMIAVTLAVGVGLALYFLPTIIATSRAIKTSGGVFVVNLFLGWTLIGWVVALAWAASGEAQPKTAAV